MNNLEGNALPTVACSTTINIETTVIAAGDGVVGMSTTTAHSLESNNVLSGGKEKTLEDNKELDDKNTTNVSHYTNITCGDKVEQGKNVHLQGNENMAMNFPSKDHAFVADEEKLSINDDMMKEEDGESSKVELKECNVPVLDVDGAIVCVSEKTLEMKDEDKNTTNDEETKDEVKVEVRPKGASGKKIVKKKPIKKGKKKVPSTNEKGKREENKVDKLEANNSATIDGIDNDGFGSEIVNTTMKSASEEKREGQNTSKKANVKKRVNKKTSSVDVGDAVIAVKEVEKKVLNDVENGKGVEKKANAGGTTKKVPKSVKKETIIGNSGKVSGGDEKVFHEEQGANPPQESDMLKEKTLVRVNDTTIVSSQGLVEGKDVEKLENLSKKAKRRRSKGVKGVKNTTSEGSNGVVAKGTDKHETTTSAGSKSEGMVGMIFMCNSKTKRDCYHYRVFGLPANKKEIVAKIQEGMRLFLFDVELRLLYGIYKATGPGGYNIEHKAFNSGFPSQVRFTLLEDCLPVPEEKFKAAIRDNYYEKNKFRCELTAEQVKKLCKLFVGTEGSIGKKDGGKKRKASSSVDPDRKDRGSRGKHHRESDRMDLRSSRGKRFRESDRKDQGGSRSKHCRVSTKQSSRGRDAYAASRPSYSGTSYASHPVHSRLCFSQYAYERPAGTNYERREAQFGPHNYPVKSSDLSTKHSCIGYQDPNMVYREHPTYPDPQYHERPAHPNLEYRERPTYPDLEYRERPTYPDLQYRECLLQSYNRPSY